MQGSVSKKIQYEPGETELDETKTAGIQPELRRSFGSRQASCNLMLWFADIHGLVLHLARDFLGPASDVVLVRAAR